MKWRGAVIGGFALAVVLTTPSDGAFTYNLLGTGNEPCESLTIFRSDSPVAYMIKQWLFGFLSGVGYESATGVNPLHGVDGDAVVAWVEKYCKDHPHETIADAAAAFTDAHPN